MDSGFLNELTDLLHETENLLASPEPETQMWEDYGRRRQQAFDRMQSEAALAADDGGERARLRELIEAILERDRLLMLRLELYLARCRRGLSSVPKAQQALKGYFPPQPGALQRQV
jgi:hypothetical protein